MPEAFKIYTDVIAEEIRKAYAQVSQKTDSAENTGTFEVIASTWSVDRHWEMVKQDGWELDNFKLNPVVLVNHSYKVESICWKATDVYVEDGKLIIKWIFAPNELGQEIRKLYESWFLKTVSVWFIVKARNEANWREITKQELIELSFIPVPANPEALDRLKELENKYGVKFTDPADGSIDQKTVELLAKSVLELTTEVKELKSSITTLLDDKRGNTNALFIKEQLQTIARAANLSLHDIKLSKI